jgi:hypothetical protein
MFRGHFAAFLTFFAVSAVTEEGLPGYYFPKSNDDLPAEYKGKVLLHDNNGRTRLRFEGTENVNQLNITFALLKDVDNPLKFKILFEDNNPSCRSALKANDKTYLFISDGYNASRSLPLVTAMNREGFVLFQNEKGKTDPRGVITANNDNNCETANFLQLSNSSEATPFARLLKYNTLDGVDDKFVSKQSRPFHISDVAWPGTRYDRLDLIFETRKNFCGLIFQLPSTMDIVVKEADRPSKYSSSIAWETTTTTTTYDYSSAPQPSSTVAMQSTLTVIILLLSFLIAA